MATEQTIETYFVVMEQPVGQVELQVQTCQQDSQLQLLEKSMAPIQCIQLLKMEPEDDPEAFLMMFECAAEAAMWPKEQWAMHLAPLLSGEALPILQALPQYIANNYDHLKNAILHHVGMSEESYRKKFRSLTFTEGANPHTVAQQLRDWGKRWLKPETRTPAEIVELIVVEQFIHILPEGAGEWLNHHQVWSLDSAVQLIEGFLSSKDLTPAFGGDSADAQTSAHGEEPLAAGMETEPEIILRFEDVLPAGDPQCCQESKGTSTEFVAMEPKNLAEIERGEKPSFRDLQDLEEYEVEDEQESPIKDSEDRDRMDRTSAELEPSSNSEQIVHQGYTDQMDHHKTILDQATDIFLQCSEQTVLFSRHNKSPNKQLNPIGNGLPKATECEKMDNKSTNSNIHSTHTEERTCLCTRCGNIYIPNSSRIDLVENLTGEKLYTCNECENSFNPPSKQRKRGVNPYACSDCGKSFNRRTHLSIHQRKHTGEKPFMCCDCGKKFNQLSNLVRHQQVHSDAKPYTCDQCGKSFRRPSHLKRHQFIHTDREKRYMCGLCGQRFTQSFNLLSHQRKRICCPL